MSRRARHGRASLLGGGTTLSGQYETPIPVITPRQRWAAQQTCLRAARDERWTAEEIREVLAMLDFPYALAKPKEE